MQYLDCTSMYTTASCHTAEKKLAALLALTEVNLENVQVIFQNIVINTFNMDCIRLAITEVKK